MAKATRKKKQALIKDGGPEERVKFAARLKIAREKRYKTQKDFAHKIGIEAERYRMWERAKREPDITHFVKIATELDVSLDFLIMGELPSFRGHQVRRAG